MLDEGWPNLAGPRHYGSTLLLPRPSARLLILPPPAMPKPKHKCTKKFDERIVLMAEDGKRFWELACAHEGQLRADSLCLQAGHFRTGDINFAKI